MNLDLEQLTQDALDGNESPLKAFAIFNDILKTAKKCQDEIKDLALEEALTHGAKTFDSDGYIFEVRNGGRRWSYKDLEEWNAHSQALKNCEARYKQAFESKVKGLAVFSEDTGEEMELPKVTYSKDSLIVKAFK